ncbi:MAG: aminotransferase class I/II-fold pyridoxal phosphate-dependent enzyme, partial [Clostridia bacterium]|nr:aminotransferase class I/II-fold pyridoxal phosphate-dependent enzyme [Clostridia bacterium]
MILGGIFFGRRLPAVLPWKKHPYGKYHNRKSDQYQSDSFHLLKIILQIYSFIQKKSIFLNKSFTTKKSVPLQVKTNSGLQDNQTDCQGVIINNKKNCDMETTLLSQRVVNMAESATLKMTEKSRELKAQGIDIISLSIGEPDFNTPESAKHGGIAAINNNDTHYPPVPGTAALRKAIAEKLRRDNGLDYADTNIIVSNGAKQA